MLGIKVISSFRPSVSWAVCWFALT